MNKITRMIEIYLISALPFVVGCLLWQYDPHLNPILKIINEILCWNLMFWFLILMLFFVMLVIVPSARERVLRRIANIKERDEREQFITGKASRVTYISTLSLLIFLFFFSVFSVSMYRLPASEVQPHKNHSLNIGLSYHFFDPANKNNHIPGMIFDTQTFTPSKSTVILIMLIWQLMVFNLVARKEQQKTLR